MSSIAALAIFGAIIYFIYSFLSGDTPGRRRQMKDQEAAARRAQQARMQQQASQPGVEKMIECQTCGAYVASTSLTNCGKTDCPY